MHRIETSLPGVCLIEPDVFGDERGWFFESYSQPKFEVLGIMDTFPQDNHSRSAAGVLRGMHFQYAPNPMGKLVRCVSGRIFDVCVDMRKDSPHFKEWVGVELTAENHQILYAPAGFAHGFLALEQCEIVYKVSWIFEKALDGNFAWNDPEIGIHWPIETPLLSPRDAAAPSFAEALAKGPIL